MPFLSFFTVDVFTDSRFGGNPLAVVMGGDALASETMQAIAAEFNLSETTFVLPPEDASSTARVRIFNRTTEMPFAGHPMVGTAFVLASLHSELTTAKLEIPAGTVVCAIERNCQGKPIGASIDAPQPLVIGDNVAPHFVASALQLQLHAIVTSNHPPIIASNGNPFVIVELTREALSQCDPDLTAFRNALAAHPKLGNRFPIHAYCHDGDAIRARMFAPLSGTWEDPATGSANAPLACLLLSLAPNEAEKEIFIHQGVEMGRPSQLRVHARRTQQGITATLKGSCVSVMQGEMSL
jgi:trans-2,3-dihydro-3-hydroxyanthranilate isomerase